MDPYKLHEITVSRSEGPYSVTMIVTETRSMTDHAGRPLPPSRMPNLSPSGTDWDKVSIEAHASVENIVRSHFQDKPVRTDRGKLIDPFSSNLNRTVTNASDGAERESDR